MKTVTIALSDYVDIRARARYRDELEGTYTLVIFPRDNELSAVMGPPESKSVPLWKQRQAASNPHRKR